MKPECTFQPQSSPTGSTSVVVGIGLTSLERFDPEVGVWELLQPMLEARDGAFSRRDARTALYVWWW